jgi:hypothetical protein
MSHYCETPSVYILYIFNDFKIKSERESFQSIGVQPVKMVVSRILPTSSMKVNAYCLHPCQQLRNIFQGLFVCFYSAGESI